MERKVAVNVRTQLDRAAGQQLAAAQENLRERVLRPLDELAVDVAPVQLATTDKRIVMRLRLAGEDHLGAHTPRPCALAGSLASMQLHESVLNNMVTRLELEGRTFRLPELYTTVAETLGWLTDVPEDLPERVRVTFADRDAVQLRCSDGRVLVTLNIAKVSHGRTRYENFKVQAFYRGSTSPEGAELVRDGTIRLAGNLKAGPQLVLRSVFSKLFSRNSRPSILKTGTAGDARLAALAIQQLEIDGGWIGMSLGAAPKLQTAARATSRPLR